MYFKGYPSIRKIEDLGEIFRLARKKKRTKSQEEWLNIKIINLATDIDHLHSSWSGALSSGGNGEILARLVGSDILTDFPRTEDENFENSEKVRFRYSILGNSKSDNQEIELHIEFTRSSDKDEGEDLSPRVTTIADFRYSLNKLKKRKGKLTEEINALWMPYNKALEEE